MSLLVTGGAGFIGSNFVRRRRASRPSEKLIVLDKLTYAASRSNLDGLDVELIVGDICDPALVERTLRDFSVDAVVHFAAETHVDRSIVGPAPFVQTNVAGTATLLDRARSAQVRRFVHVSTDEVYGDLTEHDAPFTESHALKPRSPYAASKAGADHLVRAWFETWRFPAIITRCSNNYGPYQFPEKLIPLMILNALDGARLPVYGDGLNVRDWLHVEDHCAALERVLDDGRDGEVYNIGGRSERKNLDVVRAILRELGKPESLIEFVVDRPGHDRRYAIDCDKLERELGFRPARSMDDGLRETIAWYRAHEAWWQPLRARAAGARG
jgi:dTDP-glucose 4,6-dehydratase